MTQPNENPVHLRADNLSLSRGGTPLFAGLSFTLHSGDMLWVGGANGIGKTSLLKCIAGLLRPDSGTITFAGNITALAYQGHKDAHKPALTAYENLSFWQALTDSTVAVETAMTRCGISHLRSKRAKTLSAGQSRRLSLARLLIHNAPIWIMDEPFAALDAAGQDLVKSVLRNHIAGGGSAILAAHGGAVQIGGNTRLLQFARQSEPKPQREPQMEPQIGDAA